MVVKHQLQDELTSQEERRGKARRWDLGCMCNSLFPLKKKKRNQKQMDKTLTSCQSSQKA